MALAALPGRSLSGRFYRMVASEHRDEALNPEGGRRHGGRYNAKGRFGALYCADSAKVCRAELLRNAAGVRPGDFVLAMVQVDLWKVLDLTDERVRAVVGVRREDLIGPEWKVTRELGARAREAGFDGILAPSATSAGRNLVILPVGLVRVRLGSVEDAGRIA